MCDSFLFVLVCIFLCIFVLISFNWLSSISNFCFERKFVAFFFSLLLSASVLLLLLLVQFKTSAR